MECHPFSIPTKQPTDYSVFCIQCSVFSICISYSELPVDEMRSKATGQTVNRLCPVATTRVHRNSRNKRAIQIFYSASSDRLHKIL